MTSPRSQLILLGVFLKQEEKNMQFNKKAILAILVTAASFTGSALAAPATGFIAGAQLGQSNTNIKNTDISNESMGLIPASAVSVNSKGLAGRIFGGYQFNQYLSAELGYSRYAKTKINVAPFGNVVNVDMNIVDVVGKGLYTFEGTGFGIYGKAGIAYVNAKVSSPVAGIKSETTNAVRPTFGVGAQYEITSNVVADVSWTRVQKGGKLDKSTDFYGVGLSYNFG